MGNKEDEPQLFQDAQIGITTAKRLAARALHRNGLLHTDTDISQQQAEEALRTAGEVLSAEEIGRLREKHGSKPHALGPEVGPREKATPETRNWRKRSRR